MKKIYSKPEILFEDFTVSTNIAGDCGKIVNNSSDGVCAYEDPRLPGYAVFMDGISGCTTTQPDGYNGICYDVPTSAMQLFNS